MSLDELWQVQRDFFDVVRAEKSDLTDQQFCYSLVLHLHHEVTELLDAIGGPWKTHIDDSNILRRPQVLGEVVDITKLAWEVAQVFEVTPDEFRTAFLEKSQVIEERRKSDRFLKSKEQPEMIVFDLDGVLSFYPEWFFRFINWAEGTRFKVEDLKSPDDLWTQIGITIEKYQSLKKKFWESGDASTMPTNADAVDFYMFCKRKGLATVLVTSRDRKGLEKMELDSYKWLKSAGFQFDGVFFDLDKARFIKRHFEHVVMVVEDNAFEVARMKEAGLPAHCLKRPYNKEGETFDDLKDILNKILYERL